MKFFVLILLLTALFSCAKTVDCKSGGLNIAITDLNTNDDDTVIIRTYVKESDFTNLISYREYLFLASMDSVNGVINGTTIILQGNTSSFHSSDKNNTGFLHSDYDYEIQIKNKSYKIAAMQTNKKTKKCGGLLSLDCPDCYNPVVSFKINSIQKQINDNEIFYLE